MNTITSPQKGDSDNQRILTEGFQEGIYLYHHDINITDGSEFLDDFLRMTDQPFDAFNPKEMNSTDAGQ